MCPRQYLQPLRCPLQPYLRRRLCLRRHYLPLRLFPLLPCLQPLFPRRYLQLWFPLRRLNPLLWNQPLYLYPLPLRKRLLYLKKLRNRSPR